ncbi:MAG: hypothetical protein FJ319_00765 [SAR202 cluster bacterium]|nr:hypothetical protein [SAR202 cluster bacterium]
MLNGNRVGIPIFAVVLVTLGVIFLLQNLDVLPSSIWSDLWRLWPVIIILVGVGIIFRSASQTVAAVVAVALIAVLVGAIVYAANNDVFSSGGQVTTLSEPLGDIRTIQANVDFGAGRLRVGTLPAGSTNLFEARLQNPGEPAEAVMTRNGSDGTLTISRTDGGPFSWFGRGDVEWTINLSRSPTVRFDLDSGAADMELDLMELRATSVDISTGAADLDVTMPANAGNVIAKISAGAADVSVRIPQGVAARITNESGLSSIDIASRFPKVGDVHQSSDYDTATNRIDLRISAGASDVTVR